MATDRVQIELDEDLVRRARDLLGAPGRSDSEVIAAALSELLGFSALEDAGAPDRLAPHAADALAVDEVRAHRAARDAAA